MVTVAPDLTVILDVSETVARERLRARGGNADRYERLGAEFHARVREGFRAIAAVEPDRCVVVEASGGVDDVHGAVMWAVRKRLGSV